MSRPLIDFVAADRQAWPSALAVVLLAAGVVTTGWGGYAAALAWRVHAQAQTEFDHSTGRVVAVKGAPAEAVDPRTLAAARRLAAQLAAPWSDLLSLLERNPVRGMSLTGMEPDSARAEMCLTGEARSLDVMVEYLRFLQRQPRVARAVLTSHQVQAAQPGAPVRFQVVVGWRTL